MQRPLLFDLQALLFWADGTIPRAVIHWVQAGSKIYVSPISLWEFILKDRKHPFELKFAELLRTVELLDGLMLPVKNAHLHRLQSLSTVKNEKGVDHNDPFDRLLVAQALEEDLTLVGGDRIFPFYQKKVALKLLWEA